MSWRDFWNADTPIYVNDRHKILHYRLVARDIAALVPSPEAVVLDYGCGEALSARRVAAACGRLYLCDGAPLVRERLEERFAAEPKIVVLSPEAIDAIAPASLDLIVVNSLLQYLSVEEFGDLLGLWRERLKPAGRLVLADVIPPDASALDDARALLGFAWQGGFLGAALVGLARTTLSEYRTLRAELGLTHYSEGEMIETLRERGFVPERRPSNLGHNQGRMTFLARPVLFQR
ncbi:MAG: SAM-dependent methyltransferase [Enterovirga sp.]|nr:SAM-dependent methyltransferase [Enterovirga sp.]